MPSDVSPPVADLHDQRSNAEATRGALTDKPEVKKAKKPRAAIEGTDNMGVDENDVGKLVDNLKFKLLSSMLDILTLSSVHR